MSNRLYSSDEPQKVWGPRFSEDFVLWLWLAGLGTLLSELAIYFMFVPEARLLPEHRMLMWFVLPLPPILCALLMSFQSKPKPSV